MILFDLGQRVSFGWVRRNPALLGASLAESGLSFALVFVAMRYFEIDPWASAIIASIAMATSPAVVLAITRETRAQGQITERTLLLTALNSIYAVMLSTLLLALVRERPGAPALEVAAAPGVPDRRLAGLAALGARLFLWVLSFIGRDRAGQILVMLAVVWLVFATAVALRLSPLLALLACGAFVRTFDASRLLTATEFGLASGIALVLFFALSAATMNIDSLFVPWLPVARAGGRPLRGQGDRRRGLRALVRNLPEEEPADRARADADVRAGADAHPAGVRVESADRAADDRRAAAGGGRPAAGGSVRAGADPAPGRRSEDRAMTQTQLEFGQSEWLTMGVELELQLIDRRTGDLTRGASDLIALVTRQPFPGDVKPEITESMLEISTSVQHAYEPMRDQLVAMRDALVVGADRLDLEIAGGGTHPFQRWYDRQIYDRPRFRHVAGLYGYLAKQFTVFGQHVHIGCENGTQALWLLHRLSVYIPQFIALAASSPYFQGVDTSYDCSRLNSVYAFPLSGRAPFLTDWPAFEAYFGKLKKLGVVESMKDFYWDIRPKPEYGTIEVRVFDTPLTVERAAALAAYVQAICRMLLEHPAPPESEDIYVTYNYNRFQACRFGLEGQ